MKRLKQRTLKDFLSLVLTGKNLYNYEIIFEKTKEETRLLEDFCSVGLEKKRMHQAWAQILYYILEEFSAEEMLNFLSDNTLNFLIENDVNLIDLGHLELSDFWLMKIYEEDNRCWEALETIKARNSL